MKLTSHHGLASTLAMIALSSLCTLHPLRAGDDKQIVIEQAPAPASEDDWRFTLTPYVWLPSVDVDISLPTVKVGDRTLGGDISVNQPWWDTLSQFSSNNYVLAVDGRFEAWKGRWGAFVDAYWLFGKSTVGRSESRLSRRDRVDITTTSGATSRFETGQANFGPQFVLGTAPLGESCSVAFVLYGGGRVNWVSNDVDGSVRIVASADRGEVGQTTNFNSSASRAFIEPMIGLKTSWTLGPNFKAILRGDVGGFGWVEADNWDCDLEAAIAWQFVRNVYLDLGYRARGQWQESGSNGDINMSGWFFGPELGVTFAF